MSVDRKTYDREWKRAWIAKMAPEEREAYYAMKREQGRKYRTTPESKERERLRDEARKADPAKHAAKKAQVRSAVIKILYGISKDQRQAILDAQGGNCQLCQRPAVFGKRGFSRAAHLDHCHETGRIRGVLCASCNTSIGKLGDTVEALERVVAYLKGERT